MHPNIRLQLLFPLVPLIAGLIATTAWTAWSAAEAARDQILRDMDHIAATVGRVTFPRNAQTLRLMKGLSAADLLLCDPKHRPLLDDLGQPLTTLTALPTNLEDVGQQGTPVTIGSSRFLGRRVSLQHDQLFLFFPADLLEDAAWRALRPALVAGVVGGLASILMAWAVTQRLSRRIQDLQRRTRQIAAGDFSVMPLSERRDELRDLGESVNDMAERLARFQEVQRATERLRLLGQVSGGLAHQLRNSVAGARLAIQVYSREHKEHASDESLEVALRQLALVESYLKRFLDIGRALEIKPQPMDLQSLVDETVSLLRPQCRHANIDLQSLPASGDTHVRADPNQLRQVLLNLLTNAMEAAGPGGAAEIRIHAAENGTRVVEVRDSGPGVAPEIASRLFDPFVTGKPEGVGLGLAVSRQIVEAHGGRLTWSRREGRTCFRIELPARPPVREVMPS